MEISEIFGKLWRGFIVQNPKAHEIYSLLQQEEGQIFNDHIALRTFNHPSVNIERLSEIFLDAGYYYGGIYNFKKKKLNAVHLEHPRNDVPLVFISELRLEECSEFLRENISDCILHFESSNNSVEPLLFQEAPWGLPSYKIYKQLLEESEYAAWTYAYGYRANHFTVYVNKLKRYNSIEKINMFLKDNGYLLNTSGGEIKGSKLELLEQSSTIAEESLVQFIEGSYTIPACFYEFAKRYDDANGRLFRGFIEASADKIFESTNSR